MKKKIKLVLFLILFLPLVINATSTFNEGKIRTGNYISSFDNYKKYIRIPLDSKYYAYESDGYSSINGNGFKNGGFISSFEYNLSLKNNYSWLSPGIGFWTLSKNDDNEYYYIADKLYSKDKNNKLGVRITEYVINTTKVKGSGTISNPWYFVETFKIGLRSNNENYGNLGTDSDLGTKELYIEKGRSKTINFTAQPGYTISSTNLTDCSKDYFEIGSDKLTIKSLDRDLNCIINFEPMHYTVTLDPNGGILNDNSTRDVIYGDTYGSLPIASKKGYVFSGWYTEASDGTKVTETTIVTQTKNHTLYAQYKNDAIDYETISNSFMCANVSKGSEPYIFTYTGDCEIVDNGDKNWKVKYLTSGDLTFNVNVDTDLFVVGGGGYNGGGGGYASTFKNIKMEAGVTKHIEIGAGGTKSSSGGKSYYSDSSVYYADGGSNGNGGSGSNIGGSEGSVTCTHGDSKQEWNDNWCDGGWVTVNGGNGKSYGANQYSQTGKPWSGQTTCEFDNGTISGCYDGDDAAYAPGGGGCEANAYGYEYAGSATNGAGLTGKNSGAGGNCFKDGSTGVVIIRSKIPKNIVVDGKTIATYTGNFTVSGTSSDWKITFKTDGDLKLVDSTYTDLFIVGGGGGNGGGGGYASTYTRQTLEKNVTYSIKIGRGGSSSSSGEQSYVKSGSKTYYADGGSVGTGSAGGSGGSGGGYNYNDYVCTERWDQAGCVAWGYVNYNAAGAAYGGNSSGKGQYYSTDDKPWAGQTTCEFNEGTLSGCFNGEEYAYSGGGSGNSTSTIGGGGALNTVGTNGRGGGGGVNAAGGTGIVIIRKTKSNEIKVENKVLGTYTGKFTVEGNQTNWKIKFETNGILYLDNNTDTDIFIVGGGGGNAGGGGYTSTYKAQTLSKNTAYTIRIGLGGSNGNGEQSYMKGNNQSYSANGGTGGYGGSGGSGGGTITRDWVCTERWDQAGCVAWGYSYSYIAGAAYGANSTGKGQGSTTCEFGEGTTSKCTNGAEYAYSGGGSGNNKSTAGGGGASGKAGTDGRGGGGGANAKGGSGIVIIRNKR